MHYNTNRFNWEFYHSLNRYDKLYENIKEIFNKKIFKLNEKKYERVSEYKKYIYELFCNYKYILHNQLMNEDRLDYMYFIKYPFINNKYKNILKDYFPNDIINEICKYLDEYVYIYIPISSYLLIYHDNINIDDILDTIIVFDNEKQIKRFYNKCIYPLDIYYCQYYKIEKWIDKH